MSKPLNELQCAPRHTALDDAATVILLAQVPGWTIEDGMLGRDFAFHDYYQTIAFVNALVFVTHAQDHHPELTITYNNCAVRYQTHSVGGLSENDFICAAKADALYAGAVGRA
jgi:4a-hydroxytetrahydrobiopterin dehydratase